MAKKTNFTDKNGNSYFRISRTIGTKINENGVSVPVKKQFYGSCKREAEEKFETFMRSQEEAAAEEQRKEEARKKEEAERKLHPYGNKTLAEVIDRWIEQFFNHTDLADATKQLYVDSYNRYFRESQVALMPFESVTAGHLQDWFNDAGIKYGALKAVHKLIGHFYRHIEVTSYGAYHDIARPVRLPKNNKPKGLIKHVDVWDDSDLQTLIEGLEGTMLRFMVILAAFAGLRSGELRALHFSDISEDGILTVNKQVTEVNYGGKSGIRISDTKTESSVRQVPLPPELMHELEVHRKLHRNMMRRKHFVTDIMFPSTKGDYLYKGTLRLMLKNECESLGIPFHPFHSFRKTYLTNQSRAGTPLETTSKLAGHSRVDVTAQYYINVDNERKLAANSNILKLVLKDDDGAGVSKTANIG